MEETDILVVGGGLAGLIAAAALADTGASILVVDRHEDAPRDPRSTAYLQPARAVLQAAGVWDDLAPRATPLAQLRVVDTSGTPPVIAESRTFSPEGDGPFGWNLPNEATRATLTVRLSALPNVAFRRGHSVVGLLTRDRVARVSLSDGSRVAARLVIAGDGKSSALRSLCGIDVQTTRYGQKALAFRVTHTAPHHNISTEVYASGGAFTLVPLPDENGTAASAVVWMSDGPEAQRLHLLDNAALSIAATERSAGAQGDLTVTGPRAVFPVLSQRATALTARRVALIGEAAHAMPPIGAQGLNTSLADIAALVDIAGASPKDLGSDEVLNHYAAARTRDIAARMAAIDLFNRVCRSGHGWTRRARIAGLRLVHDVEPLRRSIIRAGLGQKPRHDGDEG